MNLKEIDAILELTPIEEYEYYEGLEDDEINIKVRSMNIESLSFVGQIDELCCSLVYKKHIEMVLPIMRNALSNMKPVVNGDITFTNDKNGLYINATFDLNKYQHWSDRYYNSNLINKDVGDARFMDYEYFYKDDVVPSNMITLYMELVILVDKFERGLEACKYNINYVKKMMKKNLTKKGIKQMLEEIDIKVNNGFCNETDFIRTAVSDQFNR